ncbi:hypothetical protein AAHZ94_04115 [Streptomyces sp. HSW2009]|uniref:MmyB family transcriptional regulator n=1 Tax=Streptomyces sp. HSW2009 TaxID=3142890 RepID=UPI0032EC60D1
MSPAASTQVATTSLYAPQPPGLFVNDSGLPGPCLRCARWFRQRSVPPHATVLNRSRLPGAPPGAPPSLSSAWPRWCRSGHFCSLFAGAHPRPRLAARPLRQARPRTARRRARPAAPRRRPERCRAERVGVTGPPSVRRPRLRWWSCTRNGSVTFCGPGARWCSQRPQELVGELSVRSADFAQSWARHEARAKTAATKRFRHPLVGELVLGFETFAVNSAPGQHLVVYRAAPGTAAAQPLPLLGAPHSHLAHHSHPPFPSAPRRPTPKTTHPQAPHPTTPRTKHRAPGHPAPRHLTRTQPTPRHLAS